MTMGKPWIIDRRRPNWLHVPATIRWITQPAAVNAGATMAACAVEVLDKAGRRAVDFAGTVNVALTTPGGATLGGTVAVAAVAGVATFSDLLIDKNGTYTLTASANGLTSAASDSFAVAARIVADFEFGGSEYLSRADTTTFEFPGVDLYASCWVKLESIGADRILFGKTDTNGNQGEWMVRYAHANLAFQFYTTSDGAATTAVATDTAVTPATGTWYFVEAWRRNGVGVAIRVNRGTVVETSSAIALFAGTAAFTVGVRNLSAGGLGYHDGLLANVFVSDQVTISGSGVGTPDATISLDLYRGLDVPPPVACLAAATIAAAKRSGGASGDLLFELAEASGNRVSRSGNFTLTDNNTVGSASAA